MGEGKGYRAVVTPDGGVRVTPPAGIPVYRLSTAQVEVLWATLQDGSLDRRLDASAPDHKSELWHGVKVLREQRLLAEGRSFAKVQFTEIGLEVAQFLVGEWSGWDLFRRTHLS